MLLPLTNNQGSQKTPRQHIPQTTIERRRASTAIQSFDQDKRLCEKVSEKWDDIETGGKPDPEKTVLYLAYGSNLASKTFLGDRGIKPISLINVYVPELRLTFDLAGVPYQEPCFGTTRYRHASNNESDGTIEDYEVVERAPLLRQEEHNHDRDHWDKPLIGVVYEITLSDYAWMIATESGGRGYTDAVVDCYPFPESYDPADEVPGHPDTQPFKAHCLLSLLADEDDESTSPSLSLPNPRIRPDPSHAQPSARYLDLIKAGAAENNLPLSYRAHLSRIHSYHITTARQRMGKTIFLAIWGPLYSFVSYLTRTYARPDGQSPQWLVILSTILHTCMWACYDFVFVKVFGEGERTIGDTTLVEEV